MPRRAAPQAALWLLAAVLLGTGAAALVAQRALADARAAFDTDSRIAHRLLSQRAAEHEAVLATLALLQPPGGDAREARLAALYPQVLAVARREAAAAWPRDGWQAAEERSRTLRQPVLAEAQIEQGRYWLLHAGVPASYALQIDLQRLPPAAEWPLPAGGATAALLLYEGQRFVLQAAPDDAPASRGWRFQARKTLAADSQPFELVTTRAVGWSALPWARMALAAAVVIALLGALAAALRQRAARRRAEELLRLGQLGRLNQLGELAAGIAHELNQPLTALIAQTQAARRLLDDEPPQTTTARAAMDAAAAQARRASDVVGRLRRLVERPDGGTPQPLRLDDALRQVVDLLEPQIRRVGAEVSVQADAVNVCADPVALEQIVHNLLVNALQALERGAGARRLRLSVRADGAQGLLRVADNGPGIAAELLPRIFEPFVTTRDGGLGLGLPLCETLASGLGGSLTGCNNTEGERGAVFELRLPLAAATTSS